MRCCQKEEEIKYKHILQIKSELEQEKGNVIAIKNELDAEKANINAVIIKSLINYLEKITLISLHNIITNYFSIDQGRT